ncbi:hypothetical protein VHEMI05037 [[Torrubiella] hemipterigena]|uniref:Uncharacterized protein n=1 Tax=[Torrubiella] hemipterigena TaxID=1531966 RepID=A0A0A1T313_9HYPO|nr:hypothetical protein VHEMI05037 [[Torrubiella] hemipterigena]
MTIVLITGADRGLGLAMVKALSSSTNEYTLLLSAKSFPDAAQAARDVQEEFPAANDRIIPYEIDVTSDDSIHAAALAIERTHGRIDTLINNAGVLLDFARDAGQVTMREAWAGSWDVNVVGAQVMTTVFVPLLLRSSNPRLLFVSSGTSSLGGTETASPGNTSPPPGWPKPIKANGDTPAYRASKSGLNMMMRCVINMEPT